MVYSMADRLLDEEREKGERKSIIESILTFLGARFDPDAVQTLKPTLDIAACQNHTSFPLDDNSGMMYHFSNDNV